MGSQTLPAGKFLDLDKNWFSQPIQMKPTFK
jgi:hypothetical protein